jgi:hypothetical protein
MCKPRRCERPTVGVVQVGSLIFVVIVATWAAYLLQHWIRRREDAAAGESVERFSEAMRVLEKRTTPAMDGPTARVRPVVSVAPGARAGVESSTPSEAAPKSPLVARRATDREPTVAQGDSMTSNAEPRRVAPVGSRPVTRPADSRAGSRHTGQRPAPRPEVATVSRARRLIRAAVLLISLLWVPVSVGLAFAQILLWISVPFALLTVIAVLFWLRTEARTDRARAARHEAPRRRRPAVPALSSDDTQVIHAPAATAQASRPAHPAGVDTAATAGRAVTATSSEAGHLVTDAPASVTHSAASTTSADPAPAQGEPAVAASSAAFDIVAEEARRAPAEPIGPLAEGMWRPVPVPPPTYTMKAKADARMTDAGIPADVFSTPEFAEEAEELDERALFVRRAANQ